MITDFINKYPTATITLAQTTFMTLEVEGAHLFRVDFQEKVEAKLKPGKRGELGYSTVHPLLSNYNEDKAAIYINSAPGDPQGLYEDIQAGIASVSHVSRRWKNWQIEIRESEFTIVENQLKQNIIDGSGMLLNSAPPSIAVAVLEACKKHKVATKTFTHPSSYHPHLYSLLSIGACYVIAFGFTVRQLQ